MAPLSPSFLTCKLGKALRPSPAALTRQDSSSLAHSEGWSQGQLTHCHLGVWVTSADPRQEQGGECGLGCPRSAQAVCSPSHNLQGSLRLLPLSHVQK